VHTSIKRRVADPDVVRACVEHCFELGAFCRGWVAIVVTKCEEKRHANSVDNRTHSRVKTRTSRNGSALIHGEDVANIYQETTLGSHSRPNMLDVDAVVCRERWREVEIWKEADGLHEKRRVNAAHNFV
jgi:hypothetical protein